VFDKARLLDALRARVAADLEALERRHHDIQSGSTHEENRPEHAKDTRATEQSYLARGLAKRVVETIRTTKALAALQPHRFGPDDPIAVTALVLISNEAEPKAPPDNEQTSHEQAWWIIAGAGGFELEQDGVVVRTITPVSPLGRSLLGLQAGDEGAVRTPRGERRFEVLFVS